MSSYTQIENGRTFYIAFSYNNEVREYHTNQYNDEWVYPPEELLWKSKPYAKRFKGSWGASWSRMAFDTIEEVFDQLEGRMEVFLQSLTEDVAYAEEKLAQRKKELELYKQKIQDYEKAKNARTTSNADTH